LSPRGKSHIVLDNFPLVFGPKFLNTIVTRMDANDASSSRSLDNADFREVLSDYYLRKVYSRIRDEALSLVHYTSGWWCLPCCAVASRSA
jgi:hypothetical protein